MRELEPFRVGRIYEVNVQWLLENIEPWDQPECWYCDWGDRAPEEDEADVDHERFGEYCGERKNFREFTPREQWELLLRQKREDEQYRDIVWSLERLGFVRNVTFQVRDDGSVERMGDGHHRIAAALELGIPTVPFRAAPAQDALWSRRYEVVSSDSGSSFYYEWDLENEYMEVLGCRM